jgi:SAM-dependent methyltransferase
MDAVDSDFFNAYADVHVHQIMLQDTARNEAYWAALQTHAKGKIVLDVGSGTGFLSLLAARAGAAHVYAVEASEMAEVSRDIIEDNMLSDTITVVHDRIEDVSLPCMVDIIVSEWMGFYLVHESMMRSVLIARDRFLKPSGIMIPESAEILCAPANCDSDVHANISWYVPICISCSFPLFARLHFVRVRHASHAFPVTTTFRWSQGVHVGQGLSALKLDFSAMSALAAVKLLSQPHVQVVNPSQILADAVTHSTFDMRTATAAEVDRTLATAPRMSWCVRSVLPIHAIAVWFSCSFPGRSAMLDTSPFSLTTHWKQTLVYLRNSYGGVVNATFSARLTLLCDEDNSRQYVGHKTLIFHPQACSCCWFPNRYIVNVQGDSEEEEEEEEEEGEESDGNSDA